MNKINVSKSIYGEEGNPLDYPGQIIERPLFISNSSITELKCTDNFSTFSTTNGDSLETILHRKGAAQVQERVVQIAFGANRNLENIIWKFRNYHQTDQTINQDFIVLPGFLYNADVVACNIGYWGYIYGGLLTTRPENSLRPYLNETKCPVVLLLLDHSQLKAVHRSEGVVMPGEARPGVCCEVSDLEIHLSDNVTCKGQVYSLSVPFLSFDGNKPISLQAVQTEGRGDYPTLSQEELFRQINSLLKAEPASAERVPIAETLAKENALLLRHGVNRTRRMSDNVLYSSVRKHLLENFALKDNDGKVRCGLKDIYPIRPEENGWAPTPRFRPLLKRNAEPASVLFHPTP